MFKSKMRCLLEGEWAGKDGQDALHLFIELVGLNPSTDAPNPLEDAAKDPPRVRHYFSFFVRLIYEL